MASWRFQCLHTTQLQLRTAVGGVIRSANFYVKALDFKILTHDPNILKTMFRPNKTQLQASLSPQAAILPPLI